MTDPLSLREKSEHLSRFALDRLAADESAGLQSALAHLAGCAMCSERLSTLKAERAALSDAEVRSRAATLTALAAKRVPTPFWRRSRWPAVLVPLGLAAAALLAFVARPPIVSDTVRLKGGSTFEVLQVAGDEAAVIPADGRMAPRAELAFRVSCPSGCTVWLTGIDGDGPAYVIESSPPGPWPLKAAAPVLLPVTARLDDSPGDELFVAFACERAVERAQVLSALETTFSKTANGRRDLRAAPPSLPGCAAHPRLLHREPPP